LDSCFELPVDKAEMPRTASTGQCESARSIPQSMRETGRAAQTRASARLAGRVTLAFAAARAAIAPGVRLRISNGPVKMAG
jgi:hypothetical protein